jgi:hypothetical protein
MKIINIKPVDIVGNCRANLTLDDEFQVEGMRLENPRQSNLCLLALSHFPPIVQQLQSESHFFAHMSCPDCLSRLDQEHSVVFLLGHADKWELCQVISEYDRLCRGECEEESEIARRLKAEAIQLQQQGDYAQATQKMKAALKELKRGLI